MFGAVQFLSALLLTLLRVMLFNLVTLTELPLFGKVQLTRLIILLFRCLLRYACSSFPSIFKQKLWVLTWPVTEVSLLV